MLLSNQRTLAGMLRESLFSYGYLTNQGNRHALLGVRELNRVSRSERRAFQVTGHASWRAGETREFVLKLPYEICRFQARVLSTDGETLLEFPTFYDVKPRRIASWVQRCTNVIRDFLLRPKLKPNDSFLTRLRKERLLDPKGWYHQAHPREMLDLFCRSGAFSSAFILAHRGFRKQMQRNIRRELLDDPDVYRLATRTNFGRLCSHASYLRLSEKLWLGTDLVAHIPNGHQSEGRVVQATCSDIKAFASKTNANIWFVYIENHPYWMPFERFVRSNTHSLCLDYRKVYYQRTTDWPKSPNPSQIKEVSDLGEFSIIQGSLFSSGLKSFIRVWDLEASFCSSTQTRFARRLFLCSTGGFEYLVVQGTSPMGINPNRLLDCAWLFSLKAEAPVNHATLSAIYSSLPNETPSIRIVPATGQEISQELLHTPMTSLLFAPQALDFFK